MPSDKNTGRDPLPEELAEAKRVAGLPKDEQRRHPSAVPADRSKLAHINTYGDLPEFYLDRPFRCRDCGKEEIWKAADQKWFFEVVKAHTDSKAVRCHACRAQKKPRDVETRRRSISTHDWRRVDPAIFNNFHLSWICELQSVLNRGLLPNGYYALIAQQTDGFGPDLHGLAGIPRSKPGGKQLDLSDASATGHASSWRVDLVYHSIDGGPQFHGSPICIRRTHGDDVVAIVEIIAPDSKAAGPSFRSMVGKAGVLLKQGIHLLVLDLFPPGVHDPSGFHGALWEELDIGPFTVPAEQPLTQVAYEAGNVIAAYVELIAVGDALPEMPLFLKPGEHVSVPLKATYEAAWAGVPRRWREVLETTPKR
jgi:hypothetical protein